MYTPFIDWYINYVVTIFHPLHSPLIISCTDKKPSAANWLLGRGKSVSCEVHIPNHILHSTLKCDVADIIRLNTVKNLMGAALAGSIGGNNAHAANIVAAMFLATGQVGRIEIEMILNDSISMNSFTYLLVNQNYQFTQRIWLKLWNRPIVWISWKRKRIRVNVDYTCLSRCLLLKWVRLVVELP